MTMGTYAAYVKIPARNLARHPWRTAITAFVSVIGLCAILVACSVRNGIDRQMTFSMTGSICGDIEVTPSTAPDGGAVSLKAVSPDSLEAVPGVAYASPRVSLTGVVAASGGTALVNIVGLDPAVEERLAANLAPQAGPSLSQLGPGQAALSSVVARRLGVWAGDEVFVAVGRPDGTMERRAVQVRTVFAARADPGWLETTAYLTLDEARALGGLPPGQVSSVLVFLQDPGSLEAVADKVREQLVGVPGARVTTWKEGRFKIVQMSTRTVAALTAVMAVVLFLMTGVVLTTTVIMAVLERRREMAICAALGLKRRGLLGLLLAETVLLQVAATAAGVVLSAAAVAVLGRVGIPASSPQLVQMFAGARLYPYLRAADLAWPLVVLNALALVAAVAGAWRATAGEPVQMLTQ